MIFKKGISLLIVLIFTSCTHYSTSRRPQSENIINAPIDTVWEKTLEILPTERIDIKTANKDNYSIVGRKKTTLWSWGDDINIRLIPNGENQTIVDFRANVQAQLVDWGHEKRMVTDIFTKIKEASEK